MESNSYRRGVVAPFVLSWALIACGCSFAKDQPEDYVLTPRAGSGARADAGVGKPPSNGQPLTMDSGQPQGGKSGAPAAGQSGSAQAGNGEGGRGQAGAAGNTAASTEDGGAAGEPSHAVATWFAALDNANSPILGIELPPVLPLYDVTVRQIARVSLGGDALRIRFSNEYGAAPLSFAKVRVARSVSGAAINATTDTAVTFNGAASVTLQPKTAVWSDDIALPVGSHEELAISIYVQGSADVATEHRFGQRINYVAPGDVASEPDLADFLRVGFVQEIESSYWMSEIVVLRSEPAEVVVAFGDSITDGNGSTPGANLRYPDQLSKLLAKDGSRARTVVNAGIGGNRWLHGGLGDAAVDRFERDALEVTGVSDVVVMMGINDIGFGVFSEAEAVTVGKLTAGISGAVAAAGRAGLRVYVGTLPPFGDCLYYTDDGELMRQAVNAWIRSNEDVEGIVDFDQALRDPANMRMFDVRYDSGDHLHPNDEGYAAMAEAVRVVLQR